MNIPVNLTRKRIRKQNFDLMDLSSSNFRESNLKDCSFRGAKLHSCNFVDANIEGCDFTGAELYGSNFKRSTGTANFAKAKVLGAYMGSHNDISASDNTTAKSEDKTKKESKK